MPRPPKSPEGNAVRLTVYVTPSARDTLVEYAHRTRQSTGEVISKIVTDLADGFIIVPELSDARATPSSIAGQPGVEHRASAVEGTSTAEVRKVPLYEPVGGAITLAFYDHPGWKLSATGQNVCIRCGKTKIRSKNASCKAPA